MEKYGLIANIKHYGCLVDLLGRAGKLLEAFNLVKGMPVEPNDTVLGALPGGCRINSNTVTAEHVLELVGKLNSGCGSNDDAHYVLLSNIYAASERWQKAEGMRVVFSNKGLEKALGCSTLVLI
ncbi:Pentatricopeptide repeat-containing protein [Forsythia ovata]|uniref:Pentatricopeptide repeat-containing protein n=1 Tax=Forsythia ovata TaxID=205694 RepID=A0ABD1U4J6_9LAMI